MRLFCLLALLASRAAAQSTADTSHVYRLARLVEAERLEGRVSIQEVYERERMERWTHFDVVTPLPLEKPDYGWTFLSEASTTASYQLTYVNPHPLTDADALADAAARVVRGYFPDAGHRPELRRVYVVLRDEVDGEVRGERVLVR